ncbi:MAG TPA: hypothetical protein VJ860_09360 [Polyangia bacterium]|nr:hypothetical protein [Polyangia bacterium]
MINRALAGREGRVGVTVALTVALLQAACSTTYQPRPTGRVGLVIHYAAPVYVKDGREVPIGPFGGDLASLVADTPAAATHARKSHTQLAIGVPTYLTGVAGVIVGIAVLSGPVGWVVIGVGALTAGTGLGFMGSGVAHSIDAVNIHNDAASEIRPGPVR